MYPIDPRDDNSLPPQITAAYQADGLRDGVIVPVLQAVFLGFCSGVLAGLLTWALHLPASPWMVWLLVWFGVMTLGFSRFRARWQWVFERMLGVDLNKDGFIGQPYPEPQHIRVDLIQDDGRQGDYIDLPYPDRLPAFAQSILAGTRTFAQDAWIGSGGIFSRSEYETLTATLRERGLARWKNPKAPAQGLELTGAGRAVLRSLVDHKHKNNYTGTYSYSPTLPDEDDRAR